MNNKDLFKDVRICKLKTQLGNTQSFPKKKEKVSSYSTKYILEKNHPLIGPKW